MFHLTDDVLFCCSYLSISFCYTIPLRYTKIFAGNDILKIRVRTFGKKTKKQKNKTKGSLLNIYATLCYNFFLISFALLFSYSWLFFIFFLSFCLSLGSIFFNPFTCCLIMFFTIVHIFLRNIRY